jgi:hypothetical protein
MTESQQTLSRVVLVVAHDRLDPLTGPGDSVDLLTRYIHAGTDYNYDLHIIDARETPLVAVPESVWQDLTQRKADG